MRALLLAFAALVLTSCATVQKLDAADDVHALLIAIRDDDRAAFEARVDRRALQLEIEARIRAEGRRGAPIEALAAALAPGLARVAGEVLVRPSVFRAVAEHYGYRRDTPIPRALFIAQALKRLPDGRVCAISKKGGPCLIDFTQGADGHWKLSGFDGDLSLLRLGR